EVPPQQLEKDRLENVLGILRTAGDTPRRAVELPVVGEEQLAEESCPGFRRRGVERGWVHPVLLSMILTLLYGPVRREFHGRAKISRRTRSTSGRAGTYSVA